MTIDTGNSNQSLDEMMAQIQDWTEEMEARASDLSPVLTPISQEIIQMALESAETHQTPKGIPHQPLSQTTLTAYARGPYRGSTGRLARGFGVNVLQNEIVITNNVPYANAQFYGNPNNQMYGRGSAPLPARPYLDINGNELEFPQEDLERWQESIFNYIVEGDI